MGPFLTVGKRQVCPGLRNSLTPNGDKSVENPRMALSKLEILRHNSRSSELTANFTDVFRVQNLISVPIPKLILTLKPNLI